MSAQEIVEKAMLNRMPISFKYNKLGRVQKENFGSAHVMFISTNKCGRKCVTADIMHDSGSSLQSWKSFDLNDMCDIQIVNLEMMAAQ